LWGLWGLAEKAAVSRAHPFSLQWMYSLPYLVTLPLWYWLGARAAPETHHDSRAILWAVLASLASMGAGLLLYFAMQSRPASMAVATTSAYPVVTFILAVVAGKEDPSPLRLLGLAVIIAGVVIVTSAK